MYPGPKTIASVPHFHRRRRHHGQPWNEPWASRMNMSRLLAWAPHAHDIVRDVPRARCGIRRVQGRLVFEGAPSGLLSAAALAGLRGLLGRRGAGRLPRRLTAFRGAAAAGAAAAAAGEGAAVTDVTSALSLTLSIVPFK